MELNIQNLSKSYGNKQALKNFSANLTNGVYGLLGPNGAGKTTLMNIISGNINQDSGIVTFNGEQISKMGSKFRNILGFMPQQQSLYDQFSARSFLWYMAALKGLSRKVAKEQIDKLIELVNLKDDAHRKLGGFSGGMKQRILIAQTLLNDPDVILMDEPTAGLDPKERIKIRNFISEISFNKIIILATHVVQDIEFIAKDVMLMKKGDLLVCNDPAAILEDMADKVYSLKISEKELQKYQATYKISNISKEQGQIYIRIVTDEQISSTDAMKVHPNMEDVYLYYLED